MYYFRIFTIAAKGIVMRPAAPGFLEYLMRKIDWRHTSLQLSQNFATGQFAKLIVGGREHQSISKAISLPKQLFSLSFHAEHFSVLKNENRLWF